MGFIVLGFIAISMIGLPVQNVSKEQPVQLSNTITPVISDLKVQDVGLTNLALNWVPAQDQTEITVYNIYRDNLLLAIVSGDLHTYKVTGLKSNTWYQFSVEACSASSNCGNGPMVGVKTLSAQEATESVINKVNTLISTRVLSQKQGDALIKELASIYQLDKDNTGAVVNSLHTSIDTINSLINSGVLSPEVGRSMVDTINEVIKNI